MNCEDYILYIRKEMKEKKKYDEYVHALKAYRQYLEKRLLHEPNDIEAVCQYSAILQELRYSKKECAEPMEKALVRKSDSLIPFDKLRLHTNLAGIYESGEKCVKHLQKAVQLNLPVPHAYDALGRVYILKKEYQLAVPLFKKAAQLSKRAVYQYNYAVSLYQSCEVELAKNLLESLLPSTDQEILYAYAVCCHFTGNGDQAAAILDVLAGTTTENSRVSKYELADLYFLCGKYREHNAMIDGANFPPARECSWVYPYLYALKQQDEMQRLKQKYCEFLQEIEEDRAYIEDESLDADFSQEDKDNYMAKYQQEARALQEFYTKLLRLDFVPVKTITLYCKDECYMLDCPRHQYVIGHIDL
ncbi:tetratricopeptide repeat protein [Candidatus Soleaferrea massiliensis]|uniref:tetratricopeptide repeat protein n=1 Tax=Candidatus Soleaferrea massiliensis TaxID=1470354 RepID=UPI00058BF4C3|nr:hypothetical protein [Candidatus Soleaferrea massiliensis]